MFIADLSGYQPKNVNFNALKALVDMVILRDQFGYTITDANYQEYVKACEAVGLPFNTYAFFDAVNVSDAIAEADADIKKMTTKNQVAWIDIETVSVRSKTDSDLWAAGNAYYDELKKAGFQKVGLYSGEYFFNSHKLYNIKHDCLWLAKYNSNDGKLNLAERPGTPCDIWQFTSAGAVAGISPLDLSVIVGNKPLSYFACTETGYNQLVTGPPVPLQPAAPAKPSAAAAAPVTPPPVVHVNIIIPNLSGLHLGAVENYIKGFNWYMKVSTDAGDTVTIETGIFTKGAAYYDTFISFLNALGVSYSEKVMP